MILHNFKALLYNTVILVWGYINTSTEKNGAETNSHTWDTWNMTEMALKMNGDGRLDGSVS